MDTEKIRSLSPLPMARQIPKIFRKIGLAVALCILFILFTGRNSLPTMSMHGSYGNEFPKKVWQLWKVDVLSLEARDQPRAKSWTDQNPEFRYEILTDNNDVLYVETAYGPNGLNRPDIVHMYKLINTKIIKADVLRYLVMYAEGGVYTDIDVEALRPISRFIPQHYNEKDIDMVIGVEIDQPEFINHPILGQKCASFCQWTFMSKPRHPIMLKLVEKIMAWLVETARRQNVPISEARLSFDDVITGTGPSAFTEVILNYISAQVGHKVTWDTFHNMAESKLIGGVLVLTVEVSHYNLSIIKLQ
jgi:mannosyltransferase OCH1-like enzyme